ncbi:MAG: anaerobic sulfatase maturase, partial [Spirochaetales bacterium]|nr:anaerobic sulfatase maturase [Spirochaetales bacterium]
MEKLRQLSFLIKPASSLCNLRCRYCFYEDESENRSQKCYGIMSAETADRLIASAVDATCDGAMISVGFQGGEPTVAGLDYFRHFIEEEKKYPNRRFTHSIQTNGYALDEDWATFLAENNFLVGISVDGYKDLHDLHRLTPSGEGSFDRIAYNLELLKKHKVEFNALCVVTRQCTERPHRVYNRLKAMGFEYLQFIACLDPIGAERGKQSYSLNPEDYGRFLCATFDDWYKDWKEGHFTSVRQFDDYIHILTGVLPSSCAALGKCGSYLVVEADGSLYPCDFYVLDEWNIGKIGEVSVIQAINSEKAKSFRSDSGRLPEQCKTCSWLPICHGGCKKDISFNYAGKPENYFCPAYRFFFEYASERLMEVARAEYQARRYQ